MKIYNNYQIFNAELFIICFSLPGYRILPPISQWNRDSRRGVWWPEFRIVRVIHDKAWKISIAKGRYCMMTILDISATRQHFNCRVSAISNESFFDTLRNLLSDQGLSKCGNKRNSAYSWAPHLESCKFGKNVLWKLSFNIKIWTERDSIKGFLIAFVI